MNEQQNNELRQVFQEAQVDLPPALETRLYAIPELERLTANGYLIRLLPLLTLIPGFLWVIIRYGADLIESLAGLARGLSLPELPSLSFLNDLSQNLTLGELLKQALATITPLMVFAFIAAAAVSGALAAGWYLWRESQLDAQYISLLNQNR